MSRFAIRPTPASLVVLALLLAPSLSAWAAGARTMLPVVVEFERPTGESTPSGGAPVAGPERFGALPESYPWVRLAKALVPAVVNVRTEHAQRGIRGLGSGFVIEPDGYIATNHHVVDGASSITVTLADGVSLPARLVGSDPETDLALLKVDVTGLPTIPLGSSAALEVAEPVMVIGNALGLDHTVTVGIISGTGRVIGAGRYDDFLQTDAAINPGNSGGPLVNTRGEAVGISTAIASRTGGFQGVGFAIPIDLAKPILRQLRAAGRVIRGWLGVTAQLLTPGLARGLGLAETNGLLVTGVAERSPAERAGLRRGDVILRYDGRPIENPRALPALIAQTEVGKTVELTILRGGSLRPLRVTVGNLADAAQLPWPGPEPSAR